jgi:hypothetical protein
MKKFLYDSHCIFPAPDIERTADRVYPNRELYGYGYDAYIKETS